MNDNKEVMGLVTITKDGKIILQEPLPVSLFPNNIFKTIIEKIINAYICF